MTTFHPSRHASAEASFPRTRRNDGTEWVSTPAPLEPLWKDWMAAALLIVFMYAAFVVAGIIGG